jgi:hypothetical protein
MQEVGDQVEAVFPSLLDAYGNNITVGADIVYPSRPGGKGPLQLGLGKVTSIDWRKPELDVLVDAARNRHVYIQRTDRVAVVTKVFNGNDAKVS